MSESVNMNEEVTMVIEDATVITTPIDDTLTVSGDAADAKAVGDALALKADISQVTGVTVNGQSADAQGAIIVDGTQINMSSTDTTKVKAAIEAVDGKTGADIALNAEAGATSIDDHVSTLESTESGHYTELRGDLDDALAAVSAMPETYIKFRRYRTAANKTFTFTLPVGSSFLIFTGRQNSTQTGLIGLWIGATGTAGAVIKAITPSADDHPDVSVSGNVISITTNTTMTTFFTVVYTSEVEDK